MLIQQSAWLNPAGLPLSRISTSAQTVMKPRRLRSLFERNRCSKNGAGWWDLALALAGCLVRFAVQWHSIEIRSCLPQLLSRWNLQGSLWEVAFTVRALPEEAAQVRERLQKLQNSQEFVETLRQAGHKQCTSYRQKTMSSLFLPWGECSAESCLFSPNTSQLCWLERDLLLGCMLGLSSKGVLKLYWQLIRG